MQMPSSISTRLQYQHKSLIELIDGLSDDQIRMQIFPGKWSIFENIVHLETYQHTFVHRVRQMLEGGNPSFDVYSAEGDPLFHEHVIKSSREIIQELLSVRKEISSGMLSFNETDLARTGNHPVYGSMHMIQWLNFFLLHEAHHLFTIFKLSAELKKNPGQH
ncbi:DinB family protein [Terrimonas sp. NA20]|uniref:DinB family protein n=1 Tax=Terrimonas ginsenosidimutans TaxID=2908004 RepID=A0ABS9KL95_9BACT|nr:DinB family protein [Terrimonas ginsenosidimutans]MCG2613098.1 DinB family protein [Terrimonas ginsenosidimutans]